MNSESEKRCKELFLQLVMDASEITFPPLIFLTYMATVKDKNVEGWSKENIQELSSLNQQMIDKGLIMFSQSIMHAYANYLLHNEENIIANHDSLKNAYNQDDIMQQSNVAKERCLKLLKKNNLFEKRL